MSLDVGYVVVVVVVIVVVWRGEFGGLLHQGRT